MGVFIWLTIWAKAKKREEKKKIKERNGGNNKRNITAKKQTRTKRINIFYQPFIPCCYKNYEGCYELWQLNDCHTDVGWGVNKGSIPGMSRLFFFFFFHRFHLDSATQLAAVTTWVNRPWREAHYRLSSIRGAWVRTSLPRVFETPCLTKQGCSFACNIVVVFLRAAQICLSLPTVSISPDNYWGTAGVPISVRRWFAAVYTSDSRRSSQQTLRIPSSARSLYMRCAFDY